MSVSDFRIQSHLQKEMFTCTYVTFAVTSSPYNSVGTAFHITTDFNQQRIVSAKAQTQKWRRRIKRQRQLNNSQWHLRRRFDCVVSFFFLLCIMQPASNEQKTARRLCWLLGGLQSPIKWYKKKKEKEQKCRQERERGVLTTPGIRLDQSSYRSGPRV